MKVDETELFSTLEAGLRDFLPLPDLLEVLPNVEAPSSALGHFQHGQVLGWCEALEVTGLPGLAVLAGTPGNSGQA